jgi:AbrB family looped-hinge helix DNA binding protein
MNVTKSITGKSKFNDNGRIVIPAEIRKEMSLNAGETVIMTLEDGVLKIESQQGRVRQVQQSLNRLIPAGRRLSSELIENRRAEARQEVEEWLG